MVTRGGVLVTACTDHSVLVLEDGPPVWTENAFGQSPILLICDHASNRLPRALGTLKLTSDALQSHVAWDPGAYNVAVHLARSLNATLVSATFSRLAYDVNRPPSSPQAIRTASEIYDIPGNANLSPEERNARAAEIYYPFHDAIDALIEARSSRNLTTVLVTLHSFTPVYYGTQRLVQLGILHDQDSRLADCLLGCAETLTALNIQRNKPYGPQDGVTHTLAKHAVPRGLLNVMIEIRNDLIQTARQQSEMGDLLVAMLKCALGRLGVPAHAAAQPGSRNASRH
ncbi:MAG: N-formylglutamate amidohydrolase [Rhodomicrobium sp.]|nr:N-formylglutamate amidohydrolase [Rhodomicrobium sp.]